jgi:hypothetical protein
MRGGEGEWLQVAAVVVVKASSSRSLSICGITKYNGNN